MKPLIGIVGPTGVGKSEAALALARALPAEIVAVDSMQVYRGMEIGTGKPDTAARKEVPHHGLDLADPSESFSVAQYAAQITPVIEQIIARGKTPLLVAGSGLYLRALLDGLCPAPAEDPQIREKLTTQGKEQGWEALHGLLKEVDPSAAGRIHPNDGRRIVRALEVYTLSKQPISAWQEKTAGLIDQGVRVELFGLTCARALLYRKVEARIDGWLAAGWLDEAKKLSSQPLGKTAGEALGYKELYAYIRGERPWTDTVALIKRNTRHYAKRQLTWFRRDERVRWLNTETASPEELAGQMRETVHA